MRRAVYPGSFDPITKGHIDIIERALAIFDEVIVAVVHNPSKSPLFTLEERRDIIQKVFEGQERLRVDSFSGLLVDYVEAQDASCIVKGLRVVSDFEFEFQMALLNRQLKAQIDTVFLMTQDRYAFLSSSSVKEIASLGGDVRPLVPELVADRLAQRFGIARASRSQIVDRD